MKQFKKKEFAIIPTKVKMATKANKPSINAISMNEPMKVVMNFGRNKTEYDELPSVACGTGSILVVQFGLGLTFKTRVRMLDGNHCCHSVSHICTVEICILLF